MSGHILVCCRVRGPAATDNCISVESSGSKSKSSSVNVSLGQDHRGEQQYESFDTDHAYDESSGQEEIFNGVVRPILNSVFLGFNCSLFSYGQTGSGKTHTLVGEASGDNRGIIPRSMELIFQKKESLGQEEIPKTLAVRLSILEIYKEKLKDLLSVGSNNPIPSRSSIRIREQIDGTVWVEGYDKIELFPSTKTRMCLF
jgi:hypothetical protein